MSENPRNGRSSTATGSSAPQDPSDRQGGQPRPLAPVVDPSVGDDGLSLSGPGAPRAPAARSAFSSFRAGSSEHPVRARLLERARRHSEGEPDDEVDERTSSPADESPRPDAAHAEPDVPPSSAPQVSSAAEPDAAPSEPSVPSPEPDAQPTASLPAVTRAVAAAAPAQEPSHEEAPLPPESLLPPASAVQHEEGSLTPPPGAVMSELERIARRGPPKKSGPEISPNLTALLGALIGLTVIVSLGLLLSRSEAPVVGARTAATNQEPEAEQAEGEEEQPVEPKREVVEGPWRVQDDANDPGHELIAGKIGKQAFLRAIQDAGLPKGQAYRAYTALKGLLDLDHCDSSDTFMALVEGKDKTLVGFEYIKSKEEVYQAKPNEQGHLEGAQLDLAVERNQIRRAFVHDGKSFEESARRAGFDHGLSDIVAKALRGHGALNEFKAGDRLRVIAQEVTVLGDFSRYAGVEAMEIARPGDDPRRYYYYPHPIEGGYFDKNGKAPFEGGWRKPIPDAPITSKFNMKRMHPVLNRVMPHTGTDFGAAAGTPIGATYPGTVSFIGPAGPNGNFVRIKHSGGFESGYSHLSRFEPGIKVGDHVDRLQTIGYCGSTGRSTGPHLHFTIKKDGKFVDPESMNLDGMRVLPKSHRDDFAKIREKYDPILDEIPLPKIEQQPKPAAPSPEPSPEEKPAAGMAEPAPSPSAASKPAPAPVAQGAPAKKVEPSAIFLTDEELLKMQGLTDPGEVEP